MFNNNSLSSVSSSDGSANDFSIAKIGRIDHGVQAVHIVNHAHDRKIVQVFDDMHILLNLCCVPFVNVDHLFVQIDVAKKFHRCPFAVGETSFVNVTVVIIVVVGGHIAQIKQVIKFANLGFAAC